MSDLETLTVNQYMSDLETLTVNQYRSDLETLTVNQYMPDLETLTVNQYMSDLEPLTVNLAAACWPGWSMQQILRYTREQSITVVQKLMSHRPLDTEESN